MKFETTTLMGGGQWNKMMVHLKAMPWLLDCEET